METSYLAPLFTTSRVAAAEHPALGHWLIQELDQVIAKFVACELAAYFCLDKHELSQVQAFI
jgi:hypothetical protein